MGGHAGGNFPEFFLVAWFVDEHFGVDHGGEAEGGVVAAS